MDGARSGTTPLPIGMSPCTFADSRVGPDRFRKRRVPASTSSKKGGASWARSEADEVVNEYLPGAREISVYVLDGNVATGLPSTETCTAALS